MNGPPWKRNGTVLWARNTDILSNRRRLHRIVFNGEVAEWLNALPCQES